MKHFSPRNWFRKWLRLAPRPQREKWFRPVLEALEGRCLPSVFTVTNTLDAGPGSLRQAILDSNATPGHNTIDFDIPGTGVQTIRVGSTTHSPLPDVTHPVTIDGYSQPGSQPNTIAQGDNAVLLIQLDGSVLSSGSGLRIFTGGAIVQGLVVDDFPNNGIEVGGASAIGNLIAGNFVGVDPTGTISLSNHWTGIDVFNSASGNIIGGTTPAARNISSGNGNNGVSIYHAGPGNVVEGNFVGTDATGTAALANGWSGATIDTSSGNLIGGSTPGAGNLCSGNTLEGVSIWGTQTSGNLVEGNLIGTNASGTEPVGNSRIGVAIYGGASNNTVGGTAAGAGNVIAGNVHNDGVAISDSGTTGNLVQGNRIGTDVSGTRPLANVDGVAIDWGASGNTIGGTASGAGNLISGNARDGVNLGPNSAALSNFIQGNLIGTDGTGTTALGNGLYGVSIHSGSAENTVGGATPGARNVICGNLVDGVSVRDAGTTHNVVAGNFIGLGAAGNALGNARDGVRIDSAASGNTIGGTDAGAGNVISANVSKGVELTGADSGNVVEGNLIGTDPTGTVAVRNQAGGVSINGQASGNTVGGTAAAARNVISGNADHGVEIFDAGTSGNVVEGNYLGTNISGTAALGNALDGVGIFLGATDNIVGGTTAGAGNLISANGVDGIEIYGSGTTGNLVAGNKIGTDPTGNFALGNALDGVGIHAGASDNRVGGYGGDLTRNVISGNKQDGVNLGEGGTADNVVEGNFIGTNAAGTAALGNGLDGVSISEGSHDNTIGTEIPAGRNVISGNGRDGVAIFDPGTLSNAVAGSYIGIDTTGAFALGNGRHGVSISNGASRNVIGGGTPGVGNVISGNGQDGIAFSDPGTRDNGVGSNYIGTNAEGTFALGNALDGVEIDGGASHNVIGAETAGARNVISGNRRFGVNLHDGGTDLNAVASNFIGTDKDGTAAVANRVFGVIISDSASNNLIGGTTDSSRNLISGNAADGLDIIGAATTDNIVEGNYVGTDVTGTRRLGNAFDGVKIASGAGGNTIGGTVQGVGNLLSGNGRDGVSLNEAGPWNFVQGNLIGTDRSGTAELGNGGDGVNIQLSSANVIGGTTGATRNVISGNAADGLDITGGATTGTMVEGNYIGTDVTGTRRLGNVLDGVKINSGAGGNTIGGTDLGAGNVLSGNGRDGVRLDGAGPGNFVQGNRIGTDLTGTAALGNGGDGVKINSGAGGNLIGGTDPGAGNVTAYNAQNGVEVTASLSNGIRQNSIFGNGALGINLNDGGNNDQPAPVLTSVVTSSSDITIQGTLDAAANTTFTLEFFSNTAAGPNGEFYLGSILVTTDAMGHATFSATFGVVVPAGQFITATATDPFDNTSEFSWYLPA